MKKLLVLVLMVCVFISVSAVNSQIKAQSTYDLEVSTNLGETGTVGKALNYFVEQVNEKTDGRINARAYFGSELGTQSEQVEMAKTGSLDMVVSAPGTGMGVWEPQLVMFEFPYLFEDNEHYRRVLKAMTDDVNELVTPYGFTAVAGQSMGARNILTIEPVESLSDMKGLKMRGPNSVYVDMFEALGAAGTTTDWNEIYTALQTGVIDGMESSPSAIYSMKFYEAANNMTVTNHVFATVYYFFNTDWLESLPADLREIVLESANDAANYQADIDDESQEKALQAMIDEGLNVIELEDKSAWVDACSGMLAEYRAKGDDWNQFIDKLLSVK